MRDVLFTYGVSVDSVLDELRELALVGVLILVLQRAHVLGDVLAEDVVAVNLGVEGLLLSVVAGETLLGVGDVQTTIDGSLQGTENSSAGGGAGETDVEAGAEGSGSVGDILNHEVLSVDLGGALVDGVQVVLLEDTTGQEETGAVSGGIVGEADLDSVPGELVGVGGGDDLVTVETSVSDLGDDIAVGDTHDHAVLGRIIFVLVLNHKTLAGEVVSLALATPAELDLEALEVSFVLDDFHERLKLEKKTEFRNMS